MNTFVKAIRISHADIHVKSVRRGLIATIPDAHILRPFKHLAAEGNTQAMFSVVAS